MSTRAQYDLRVYRPGQELPASARDLFGDEVVPAWEGATTGSPLGPMCIGVSGAPSQGLAGGIFMLIEADALAEVETGSVADVPKVASIRQLVIRPEHRGRGLAGQLLRRATVMAREAGCARLRSTAGWGCPDHLMIYHRLGFERAGSGERPFLVTKTIV